MILKANDESVNFRTQANRLYVQKHFYDALLKYNESLCFAEPESENLGLSYANRSAVYFEMKCYEACLKNIKLARLNHYPEKNVEILRKREEQCNELMKSPRKSSSDPWNFFKLSYPPNKKLPFIANCLELRCNEKYGRFIITNQQLKVGDIVAIDEPTFKVIKADSRYSTCFDCNIFQRCSNCLRENLLDLIPCENCCKTMFCSEECKSSAQRYHRYECEIIDDLLKSGITHIVLRMFFESLALFDHDMKKLETFVNEHKNFPITSFDINFKNPKERKKSEFLSTIGLASSKVDEKSLSEYKNIFKKTEILSNLWNVNSKFICEILKQLISVGTRDVHGIGGWTLKLNTDEAKNPSQCQQLIGNCCNLFSSLFNHSCAPNVRRLNVDDKAVIIVTRPIPKGSQLFDSYRANFNNQAKAERQEALMKDYGFKCDCEACTDDWPLNQGLEVVNEELLELAWDGHEELPYLSQEEAKAKFRQHCELFTEHNKHFPSAELVVLQECISNCLIIITKPSFQFP